MSKYKCIDCSHVFGGDLSTMNCPNCGSSNIKKGGGGGIGTIGNLPWGKILIGVVVVIVLGIIIARCSRESSILARMAEKGGVIYIEVDGVRKSKLKSDYKIVIYDDKTKIHQTLGFGGSDAIVKYPVDQLLENNCYTFNIERKSGSSIKQLTWETSNQYCVPIPPAPLVRPEIESIDHGVADHTTMVWNQVKVIMRNHGSFTYYLDGLEQASHVFNNVKPGNHEVVVKNAEGLQSSQAFFLKDIKKLDPPLTIDQVQKIFDKVTLGTMSATSAQAKIAVGGVYLTSVMEPDIKTLWGALQEASMGVSFRVKSFDNDPNTNKIKSGTLILSKK